MTYIENVFLCIASPLLIAALCMGKRQRKFFLFCLAGMGACLLSAYINTFFAALYRADTFTTTTEIAPVLVSFAEELGVKNATLMWPLRIAVAGKLVTPGGAVEICHILGREETIKRVKAGIAKLA